MAEAQQYDARAHLLSPGQVAEDAVHARANDLPSQSLSLPCVLRVSWICRQSRRAQLDKPHLRVDLMEVSQAVAESNNLARANKSKVSLQRTPASLFVTW